MKYDMKVVWTKEFDELSTRYFFRYFSFPISYLLINFTNFTPNTVTFFSFFIGALSVYFFSIGNFYLGGLFAFLFPVFDSVDGDIARVKGLSSDFGKWLDGIIGFILIPAIIFSIGLGTGTRLGMVLGALAMVSFPMLETVVYFYKFNFTEEESSSLMYKKTTFMGKVTHLFRNAYGVGLSFLLLTIFMALNLPYAFLIFQAVIGNLFWLGIVFIEFTKMIKKG